MPRKLLVVLLTLFAVNADAQEIVLRHALSGVSLDALSTLVVRFNDQQKGKGRVVLQELSGVADKRQLPDLALLDDADAWTFFDTRPRFRPMADVMRAAGQKFDAGIFLPQIADAADDGRGRMLAVPMALALPALFFNREAFVAAGLDPERPPKTWWELQQAAGKLYDAGYACPLTSSRFAWVHVENVASQHGERPSAKVGGSERYLFNNLVAVKHLALLASWQKSRYFHYFGPGREGDEKFASGECAMLTGESVLYADLKGNRRFTVGVAALPYYEDVYGARPAEVLPDGPALWMLAGRKKEQERLAARFVAFLMIPEVQREWVTATGFLPMTSAALDALAAGGTSPSLVEAARQRLSMPKKANARLRFGLGRSRLRAILAEEVDFVWQNKKPAKEALDTAMERASRPLPPEGTR